MTRPAEVTQLMREEDRAVPAGRRGKRAPADGRNAKSAIWLHRAVSGQAASVLIVIVVLAVLTQSKSSVFLTHDNLITLLRAAVTTFVIGGAATLVFTSGGLDLSVGSVFNLSGIVLGELVLHGVPWSLALIGGLAAGLVVGVINAVLIIYANVPPIISTLATLYAVAGLTITVTDGNPISPLPSQFDSIGQDDVYGVPWLIVIAILLGIVFHTVLAKTRFGYDVQAMGGNERAALANGVRIRQRKLQVYAISGLIAGLAGILYTSRTGTADPQAGGTDITFEVITAVLIGGTSLFGGIGSVVGTALGAVLFAEIDNALTIADINPLYSNIIVGVILAAAVALDSWRRSRAFKVGRGGG